MVSRIEVAIWVLIYGGIAIAVIGAVARGDAPGLGAGMLVAGVLAVIVGIVGVFVRARMATPSSKPPENQPR
ncbi:hypothetical protein JI739_00470 [Ramlibacter sp. AW1]|uniref:Uncharacterized protein n=1 Tax=Ramlibacter aurantiacus TaxID=2801330 RepID=A0A937D309_9BURK|nr:hypothetical protein [Ramlibacter aurantiacus]MBL0418807.1 hypothetical protein [Ramlibacter aurantiacus]